MKLIQRMLGQKLLIVFLILVVLFNIWDIYDDLFDGSSWTHIAEESVMILIFIGIIVYLINELVESNNKFKQVHLELANIKEVISKQSDQMKEARLGYAEVIKKQFNDWQLSPSEAEVGLLMLKGLSLKEIAEIRNTKEKSTRQQASSIYQKAGLTGRHEFAGWFFEDITA